MGIAAMIGSATLHPRTAVAAPIGPEFRVNTETFSFQMVPDVASDAAGDFVVVWSSFFQDDGTDWGVYGQRYNSRGARVGTEFRVNTHTSGNQSSTSVARSASGAFVAVWNSDQQDGSDFGVYGQRFAADGTPAGPEFRVNSFTTGTQGLPDVAMDAQGNFLVAWASANQASASSEFDVYAQRFLANGSKQGPEFRVNTATAGDQSSIAVAMSAEGRAVVAWTSTVGGQSDIVAQRYAATGAALGSNFTVNAGTAGNQNLPAVAMDANGNFVVAWGSDAIDGSSNGVVAQLRAANGSIRKSDFRVNTFTTGAQNAAAVGMDASGDFLVSWSSVNQDGAGGGVYGQRFDVDGAPRGTEFRVNTHTAGSQANCRTSLDADGDAVVVWHSDDATQDGSAKTVQGQRFSGLEPVDLTANQVDSPDPAAPHGALTYTVRVSNLHPASTLTGIPAIDDAIGTATGLEVTDTLPGGATAAAASGSHWTCPAAAGGKITCRYLRPLPAGAKAPAIEVHLTTPNSPGATISNAARAVAEQTDPKPANNRDVETTALQ